MVSPVIGAENSKDKPTSAFHKLSGGENLITSFILLFGQSLIYEYICSDSFVNKLFSNPKNCVFCPKNIDIVIIILEYYYFFASKRPLNIIVRDHLKNILNW